MTKSQTVCKRTFSKGSYDFTDSRCPDCGFLCVSHDYPQEKKPMTTVNNAMKIIERALSDDTGSSSKALCRFILGIKSNNYQHPYD